MGLLDRWRRGGDRERDLVEAAPASNRDATARFNGPVIRAEDLRRGPAWMDLPPIPPLLPPVPFVIRRDFERDLVSWKVPERFVGQLGHTISEAAPSGSVEVISVLASEADRPGARVDGPGSQRPGMEVVRLGADTGAPQTSLVELATAVDPHSQVISYGRVSEPAEPVGAPSPAPTLPLSVQPRQRPPQSAVRAAERGGGALDSGAAVPSSARAIPLEPLSTSVAALTKASVPPELPVVQLPVTSPAPFVAARVPVEDLESPSPPDIAVPSGGATTSLQARIESTTPLTGETAMLAPMSSTREHSDEIGSASHLDLPLASGPTQSPGWAPGSGLRGNSMESEIAPPTIRGSEESRSRPRGLGAPIGGLPETAVGFDVAKLVSTPMGRARITALARAGSPQGVAIPGGRAASPSVPATVSSEASAYETRSPAHSWARLPVLTAAPLDLTAPVALERIESPAERSSSDATLPDPPLAPLSSLARPILEPRSTESAAGIDPVAALPTTSAFHTTTEGEAVRAIVGQRHGIDLSGVPIDRSPHAATQARDMGARAFTSGTKVAIPAHVGSLDSGAGAALLAHELTHVAQRHRSSEAIPDARSEAGQRFEIEAASAEAGLPLSPVAARSVRSGGTVASAVGRDASSVRSTDGGLPVAAPTSGVDKTTLSVMINEIADRLNPFQDVERTVSMTAGGQTTLGAQSTTASTAPTESVPTGLGPVQMAAEPSPTAPPAPPPSTPTPDTATTSPWAKRPDEAELESMARWLYPIISYRLRTELRDGHARSGSLSDIYGRW